MSWKEKFVRSQIYYEEEDGLLYHADALEILKQFPDESVDLIVTDPPYGISYRKKGEPIMIGDAGNVLGFVLPELYRVLKKEGAIYIFTSFKNLADWLYRFQNYFKMHNLIIWDKKRNSGLQMGSNYGFRYEMIFFGSKGLHKLRGNHDDVIEIEKVKKRLHPTEKPVELFGIFVKMSSDEGDIVLDPFAGSGSSLVACKKLGRKFIGIELNGKYCEIAKRRLSEIKLQKGLFER